MSYEPCRVDSTPCRARSLGATGTLLSATLIAALLIGCPEDSPSDTTPPDTTPPAQSVSVNNLTAADSALSFELDNPNTEAVQVAITLSSSPSPSTGAMILFDAESVPLSTAVRIPLAATGNADATKQIRITGLTNGTAYTLAAATLDANGNRHSDTAGGRATPTAPITAPSAPTGLKATPGDNQVILNWGNVTGADEYYIYRATAGGMADRIADNINISRPTHTDTGLTNGTEYIYTVSAVNTVGESAVSDPIPAIPSDDHGDTPATATAVANNSSTAGEINPGGDVDHFSVEVPAGQILRVRADGSLDTVGTLLNSGATELATDDDSAPSLNTLNFDNFEILHNAATAGTYFTRVESAGTATGNYTLIASFATATAVNNGSTIAGSIDSAGESDYFSIQVNAGQTLRAHTTDSSLDTYGHIYSNNADQELVQLAVHDDINSDPLMPPLNENFDVSHTATSTGSYLIRVRGIRTNTGSYTLNVSVN